MDANEITTQAKTAVQLTPPHKRAQVFLYGGIALWALALTTAPLVPSLWHSKYTICLWVFFIYLIGVPLARLEPRIAKLSGFLTFNPDWRELEHTLRGIATSRDVVKTVIAVATVLLLTSGEVFLLELHRSGGLAWNLACVLLVSSLFPLSSIPGLYLAKQLRVKSPSRGLVTSTSPISRVRRKFSNFLIYGYPYFSFYLGFLAFCAGCAFAPDGIGEAVCSWLFASVRDANIDVYSQPVVLSEQCGLLIQSLVGASLFFPLRSFASRLGAGFQLFLQRLVIYQDSVLDAAIETVSKKGTTIPMVGKHPHLMSVMSITRYLILCYALIFWVVAFCPGALGSTIGDWLASCVRDAGIHVNLHDHFNLRLFIASVLAAFGTAPFAVMSCAFLPNRKSESLTFSSKGILFANSKENFLGLSPLKSWQDLKSVSVVNAAETEKQVLQLSFGFGSKVKLKTNSIEKEQLCELLATADQFAHSCRFESSAVSLKTKLDKEVESNTLATPRMFSSTIFTPRTSGDTIHDGAYRIICKLSGKPLSTVYLARDQAGNHVIAKEFVLPSVVQNCEQFDATFNREFNILSSICHERIAKVLEKFEENCATYLIIEHVRGADLRSIVEQKGPRNEKKVLLWARQIAEVMVYLHKQDPPVLHRDLSPDNLMEDEDGNIKLIDFGAAHHFLEGVTGTLIGKQCYIAPEQLRGKPSTRSDIYSFGCTLYFLRAGVDPSALQQSDLSSDSIDSGQLLHQLILKCTEFDEDKRFHSFTQIVDYLNGNYDEPIPVATPLLEVRNE